MKARKLISTMLGILGCAGGVWAAPPQPELPYDAGSQSRQHRTPPFPPGAHFSPPPFGTRVEVEPFDGRPGVFIESIADDEQQQGTPWIGVQLAPLPAALSAQLNLNQKGLMVRNVFKNSPADKAGLQRYDVLVKTDDSDVTGTVEAFSRSVRDHKIGDTLHFTIIRGGKELQQDIQLAGSPRPGDLEMKFPEEPDVLFHRDFDVRGRILRPGPNGWEMQDLGDLPRDFQQWFGRDRGPSTGGGGAGAFRRDGRESPPDHARRVGKDGEKIDVRRQKDGNIEVRREKRTTTSPADAGAKADVAVSVYPNMEELRKGDPEAADLLAVPPTPPLPPQPMDGRPDGKGGMRKFTAPVPAPAPQDPRWREWRERFFRGPFGETEPFEQPVRAPHAAKAPNVQFDVQPDGKITVHKRDKNAEIAVTYASRDEFKQKAPELFKQFEAMEQEIK